MEENTALSKIQEHMEENIAFSKTLRRERTQRGWSQKNLAEKVGCDPQTIARWEKGESAPTPYYRTRLAEVLGTNMERLKLVKSDEPEAPKLTLSEGNLETSPSEAAAIPQQDQSSQKQTPAWVFITIVTAWLAGLMAIMVISLTLIPSPTGLLAAGGLQILPGLMLFRILNYYFPSGNTNSKTGKSKQQSELKNKQREEATIGPLHLTRTSHLIPTSLEDSN